MIQNLATLTPELVGNLPMPGYYWKLSVAQTWLWSDAAPQLRDAITLLTQLRRDYPHAMQIGTELALALIHNDQLSAAENLLRELAADWGAPDEELLCRWGRLYKDTGDKLWAVHRHHEDHYPRICAAYERSLAHYEEAYAVRHGHYPGINVATLRLLVASFKALPAQRDEDRQRSRQIALDLLQKRAHWPGNHDDDSFWHHATEGEAYLLLEQWDAAQQAYHRAFANTYCLPGRRVSIEQQLQRVFQAYERMGTQVPEALCILVKGRADSKAPAG
ncbi:MAG: DUF4071 domain-containing protein [Planctomycetaceae bacterium]|nr:DUF4071 domain-containing protein [Planctomycetaceae bacterium]